MTAGRDGLDRRDFLRLGAGGGAALALNASVAGEAKAARRRPNIVFILADDLGYGDVGCYGQKSIRTPSLDRMAAEGMRFTDFYSGSTVCIPSRCCLMTGFHTGHSRLPSNAHKPLLDSDVTVAEVLKAAGYVTGCVGKWALGDDPKGSGAPHRQGWDYYYGEPNQTKCHSYYLPHHWEFDRDGSVSGLAPDEEMRLCPIPGNAEGGQGAYCHDLLTEKALAFVDAGARGETPFFLYVPYCIPHSKLQVPSDEPYSDRDWPQPQKNHAAMITRMDRDIGRLAARLAELGVDRDTVVFFSSDNGPHREGGAKPDFFKSAGPLRGIKRSLHEGGIRVPTIVRWPGAVGRGLDCDAPLAFWDFLPTAADVAGVVPPAGLDGISFVPALTGKRQKAHEHLYWEYGGKEAVRMGRWKAVRQRKKKSKDWTLELYDLRTDIGEERDVADANPAVVAKVEAALRTARAGSRNSKG